MKLHTLLAVSMMTTMQGDSTLDAYLKPKALNFPDPKPDPNAQERIEAAKAKRIRKAAKLKNDNS